MIQGSALACLMTVMLALAGCGGDGQEEESGAEVVRIIGSHGFGPGQLFRPRGIFFVDEEELFYVVDWDGRIHKFSHDGRLLTWWRMPEVAKGKPEDLCLAGNGNLLVADTHYSRIVEFTPEGELVGSFGSYGYGPGQFIYPVGICVDRFGFIYVSEYGGSERIQKFSAEGEYLSEWGKFGSEPGEFQRPSGMAIGPEDTLYVADAINHRIQVFDLEGKLLRHFGQRGKEPGAFTYPYDVAISGDRVYVVEYGSQRVQQLTLDGRILAAHGDGGSGRMNLAAPWRLTASPLGVFVSDTYNHRIVQLHFKQ